MNNSQTPNNKIKAGSLLLILLLVFSTISATLTFVEGEEEYAFSFKIDYPDGPYYMTFDNSGNLYVSERYGNKIQKFKADGEFITSFGEPGSGAGQFDDPEGIATDDSYLYVADCNNSRIQRFDLNGGYAGYSGEFGTADGQYIRPAAVALDPDGVFGYVADRDNNRITKAYIDTSAFILKWGSSGISYNQFNCPQSIAVDNDGFVYIGDEGNHRIQKFTSMGEYVTQWGGLGTEDGKFNDPEGIAIDSSNNIYVVDSGNNRIQKFYPNGTFITKWGTPGMELGQFNKPYGIAINATDAVYVADTGNKRIQIFTHTTPTTGTLIVECTDNRGEPLSATDIISTSQPEEQTPLQGTADENGIAEFREVRPGAYTIETSRNGQVIGRQSTEVSAGQETRTIVAQAPSAINLSIQVKNTNNAPVPGAKVLMVNMPDGQFASTGYTDANGKATDYSLLPGDYVYEVSKLGYTTATTDTVTVTTSGTTEITVILSTELSTTGNLKIIVLDTLEAPILGGHVESFVVPSGQTRLDLTSESSHNFFFSNVKSGVYELKASKSDYITTNTGQVNVVSGQTTEVTIILNAEAQPTGDLEVTVKNIWGNPVGGATVSMTSATNNMQPLLSDITNLQGLVVFTRVLPGNYILKVQMNGFNDATSDPVTVVTGRSTDVTITMHSNVLDRFVFNPISNTQIKDNEFDIIITAKDPFGEKLESYSGINSLTGSNAQISPTSTGQFIEGIWQGRVKVLEITSSIRLITTNSDGKSGESNSFEVIGPASDTRTPTEISCEVEIRYHEGLISAWTTPVGFFINGTIIPPIPNIPVHMEIVRGTPAEPDFLHTSVTNTNGKFSTYWSKDGGSREEEFEVQVSWDGDSLYLGSTKTLIFNFPKAGSPCLIATATYGGSYAAEVVYMRHVRDDLIGSNEVGKILVTGWNKFYYSWSPPIAYTISESTGLKSIFSILLLPLLGMIHVIAFEYNIIAPFSTELASIISFLTAAILATSIYIILPVFAMLKIRTRKPRNRRVVSCPDIST
jgi:sugar lactone lactonase YvrE